MSRVLLTNGVYARELGRLPKTITVLDTDRPIGQRAGAAKVHVEQGNVRLEIDRLSTIHFLPFRSPFESSDIKVPAAALYDGVALVVTLQNLGFTIRNDPGAWLRAYDRSILFALAEIIDIPRTELVQGLDRLRPPQDGAAYLVKSGLGIKKAHRGEYLAAAVMPPGLADLRVPKQQRYAVQRYLPAEREVRAFVVGGEMKRCLCFEMPMGSAAAPDWRDELEGRRMKVSAVADGKLEQLCLAVLDRLGLDYVCLDLLFAEGRWQLVDVNPHGSWSWLPKAAAGEVRRLLRQYLTN